MPDPKKRVSPNPGKASKTISIMEQADNEIEKQPIENESQEVENLVIIQQEEIQPKEIIKDIMRSEPILTSLIVEHYEGGVDDNGFYNGEGIASFKSGMVYKGEFVNGKMHGHGICSWSNGTVFTGDFVQNVISGRGMYCWPDGSTYEGDIMNGLRHGFGTFKGLSDRSYAGQWKNGQRHGKGIIYYDLTGDSYYDGDWFENEKCGYGMRRFKNTNMYEGEWKSNVRNGQGRMYWYNVGQEYFGNWVNGIQNGHGENIWYLKRVGNSQYPLRNHYVGEFVDGERQGTGTFHYASGAVYEGDWKQNMKHGNGKFIFKNGCVFSGTFCDDHMLEFPDLILSGMTTPDISRSGLPVQSPLLLRTESALGMSGNAVDAFLDIDLDDILKDYKYDLEQRQEEINQIVRIILRFTTQMKHLYKLYSCLGVDTSVDNTFVMTKLQFLRFLKDYSLHKYGHSLIDIERHLGDIETCVKDCNKKMFIKDFLNSLIKMSYLIFKEEVEDDENIFSNCFRKLVEVITNNWKANVNGNVFQTMEKSHEIMQYADKCFEIYFYFTVLFSKEKKKQLTMRNVMFLFKILNLFNQHLTATVLVKVLTIEDKVEGYYNLDTEITALEFLEVLIAASTFFIRSEMIQQVYSCENNPADSLPVFELSPTKSGTEVMLEEADNTHYENVEITSATIEIIETSSSEPIVDVSPSKSSGITSQKISHKTSKKMKSESKKFEKESSTILHSKSKEKTSRTEKKTSQIKSDEFKRRSSSSIPKKSDDTSDVLKLSTDLLKHDSSGDGVNENNSNDDQNASIKSDSLQQESSAESKSKADSVEEETSNDVIETVVVVDDFHTWVLKLNMFFNNYLFPAYKQRKLIDGINETNN